MSDLLVFGKRAGEFAAKSAKERGPAKVDAGQVEAITRSALEPFDRPGGENPFVVQADLQKMMQDLVGIVRTEAEMARALDELSKLSARAAKAGVPGNREYNPGWHAAIDLRNLLLVSEAVCRAALERKESRGAQFREDYPAKSEEYGKFNIVERRGSDGSMRLERVPLPPVREDLRQVIEENK